MRNSPLEDAGAEDVVDEVERLRRGLLPGELGPRRCITSMFMLLIRRIAHLFIMCNISIDVPCEI